MIRLNERLELFNSVLNVIQRFLRSLRGTGNGTNRARPIQADTGPDRIAWTGTSLGLVCAGPYRVSNGLCRCLTIDIVGYRPLESLTVCAGV